MLGDSEKTSTDKKRERRKRKKVKSIKIQEKEKRRKLKDRTGENKKQSKAEVAENLKKLTKGGKATLLKVSVFFLSACLVFIFVFVF